MKFLRTTVLGGLLFLVPFAIVAFALGKAFDLVRGLVVLVEQKFPQLTIQDVVLLDAIVIATLLLVCFLAGLFARSSAGRRLGKRLDDWLLSVFPYYSFIKGVTDGLRQNEETSRDFMPVVAHFDDNMQLAFEVERTPAGQVVLFVPGSPDPWSGSVIYMTSDRVEPIQMTVTEAMKNLRSLGRGSTEFADKRG